MNWKLRLKNKTTLAALVAAVVTLVYQILGIAGVVPAVSSEQVINWIGLLLNILVTLGVLVDPTTAGISDSEQAKKYYAPKA